MGLLRLRRRRDRFGPGICNDAMRSETLQFGTFVMLCVYIRYVYSDCDVDVTDLDPEIVMVLCVARHCMQFGICTAVRIRSETLQFFASKI